jgi:folate-binding protein YgfZ
MLHLEDGIGLVLPRELSEAVVQGLSIYRLRAKVSFEIAGPEWQHLALAAQDDLGALDSLGLLPERRRYASRSVQGMIAVDIGAPRRVVEVYGPAGAFERTGAVFLHPLSHAEWQGALIEAGFPTIVTATSQQYTPHMLNLDRLGAISFDKGCYTGQEIVARTEHRGSSRRRLMHYRLESGNAAIGDTVEFDGREAGKVLTIVDQDLLAVVQVEAHNETVAIRGHRAVPVAP